MTSPLLWAVWIHLAACVLLTGSFSVLALAGQPHSPAMRHWEEQVIGAARWIVLVALGAGMAWLAIRTASFEGRVSAAFEPQSILRATLQTWPGTVWLVRHCLLLLLALLLWMKVDVSSRWDWLAVRYEMFLLAVLALGLSALSGHSAAADSGLWPKLADVLHLVGAGIWVGGLPPLAMLMHASIRDRSAPDPYAIRAMRRFSPIALLIVLVLAVTGTVMAWLLVGDLAGLLGTDHGHLLLAKLALLVPVLALAAVNRALLPKLSKSSAAGSTAARRMGLFIGAEAAIAVLLVGIAAWMTVSTPARHTDPVWPLPVRFSPDAIADIWVPQNLAWAGLGLAVLTMGALSILFTRRWKLAGSLVAASSIVAIVVSLSPSMVEAFPTSFARSPVSYASGSIAKGADLYRTHCATCHARIEGSASSWKAAVRQEAGVRGRRSAGELFWLTTHGLPEKGMPAFAERLDDAARWHIVNYLRALDTSLDPREVGPRVEPDNGWLVAPDFPIDVGPLTPRSLRDFRGRKMVLLVLYSLPASRERMIELARRYGVLSVLGLEVVAVGPRSSDEAIAELGANPPVYFPVVTSAAEEIGSTYRLLAGDATHAEFLIDRQGYIRAIWRDDLAGMPDATSVQAQVERLNEEKAPPPLPDDHIH